MQSNRTFNTIGYILVGLFTLLCFIPFWILVMGSFTAEKEIMLNGLSLFPKELSLNAYKVIFNSPGDILNAYKISIFITVFGTGVGLFITAMTAYVLSNKNFKNANKYSFFFYFTTLFSGGMIPGYILMVQYLHMKNTIWALILPNMISVFNLLLMKSFVKSIPFSIAESAKIDGASEFTIFTRLYLPMMKPSLASIGLFIAIAYWNNWSNAMLYIDIEELYPVQYLLYRLVNSVNFLANISADTGIPAPELPTQSIKLAMTVVSLGPVILFYPFVQKYFVQGITLGSVKG